MERQRLLQTKITVKEIANDTIANATISEDGKTLTITGKEAGETTITVTDGTMEKQISVTVSVEPTLNLAIEPASIQVGGTAALTPSMSDGSDCSGVTYSITKILMLFRLAVIQLLVRKPEQQPLLQSETAKHQILLPLSLQNYR